MGLAPRRNTVYTKTCSNTNLEEREKGFVLAKRIGSKNYTTDQDVRLKINPGVTNVFHKESGKLMIKAVSVAEMD